MDFYDGYPDRLVTDLNGTRIAQAHGHLFQINFSFQKLDLWAQEENVDICLYGHLHIPDAWMEGKTLFLNPGSISQPRGLITERLYAKVEKATKELNDKVDALYSEVVELTEKIAPLAKKLGGDFERNYGFEDKMLY